MELLTRYLPNNNATSRIHILARVLSTMITTNKVFGSYVLTKVDFDKLAAAGTIVDEEGTCAVPSEWTELMLLEVRPHNHDTSIFRFQLPKGKAKLSLPVGGFLLVLAPGCEHDGTDAIRPYTSIQDDDVQPWQTLLSEECPSDSTEAKTGTFELLCKRYDQWGVKESVQTHFLFTKTNHSYRPAGAVSNYIHKLKCGNYVKFKHTAICRGKLDFPFKGISSLTMIAVGVGVAPMIQTLRGIFKSIDQSRANSDCNARSNSVGGDQSENEAAQATATECSVKRVVLLYGVVYLCAVFYTRLFTQRTVVDILLRSQLEAWQEHYGEDTFKVVFCVGSRWANVHWGVKTRGKAGEEYAAPPVPDGFNTLKYAEQGWVNEEVVKKHGFPPAEDTRVLVCGLPGVYDKLCGTRESLDVEPYSILHRLGYTKDMVVKL